MYAIRSYYEPNVGGNCPVMTPADSDEFDEADLGLQWQWHANHQSWWSFVDKGVLKLFSAQLPNDYKNLWNVPNLLLQKLPSNNFTASYNFV